MSIFYKSYDGVPQERIKSGLLCQMRTAAELRLYLFLVHTMDRLQKPILRMKNEEIHAQAGLAAGSIERARKALRALRLVDSDRGTLGVYTYYMIDPATGELCEEQTQRKRKFEDPRQKPKIKKTKPENPMAGVNFSFGHNVVDSNVCALSAPAAQNNSGSSDLTSMGVRLDFDRRR